jgi:hypothetical protein
LTARLDAGGHLVSLPKESAALANLIEVALIDFLLDRLSRIEGAPVDEAKSAAIQTWRSAARSSGAPFHAVDMKIARLNKDGYRTQCRCTLYTGKTYFKWPTIWSASCKDI